MKNANIPLLTLCLILFNHWHARAEGNKDHPVLLEETFENGAQSALAKRMLAHPRISLVKNAGPDGSTAIRVAYEGYQRGSKRVVVHHPLSTKTDQATLSFDVCFEKKFQWVHGGKLHGLGPKNRVTGGNPRRPDGWSARIMFEERGKCSTYLYDQDKRKKYGVGKTTKTPVFTAGRWHHVTLQVSLNTPGKRNGFARILIDHKEVMTSDKINFRGEGGDHTQIQQFLFSTFHGGQTPRWAPIDKRGKPITVYAMYDNIVVTKGIGQKR